MTGDGAWGMTWIAVPCGVTSNVQYLLQGSNSYYIKLQVRNTNYPVSLLRAQSGSRHSQIDALGSTFYDFQRTSDNFWTAPANFPFPWSPPLTVQVKIQC